jgi:hypothetical protein
MRFVEDFIRKRFASLLRGSAVVTALAFFAFFAGKGLRAGFTADDLMNLHLYMTEGFAGVVRSMFFFWSTAFRPLGGLFYLTLYCLFGFNPLPFRVVCFALLLANLFLAYRWIVRLSASQTTGILASLLLCYHAWFVDLYYSSGTVYDLLCYFFYFAAFGYYLKIREAGRPAVRSWIFFIILYICALDAKEMAVTLPLLIFLYELIYSPPRWSLNGWHRWITENGTGYLLSGLITIPYVLGKLLLKGSLVENPAYQIHVSPNRFLDTFHLYLNPLFYQDHFFRDPNTIQLMVIMLAFALWRRSRHLLFAWFFLLLSGLPVMFMAHYAAFFMYIPAVGWALYIAGVIGEIGLLLKWIASRVFNDSVGEYLLPVWQVAAFCGLAAFLASVHPAESRKTLAHFQSSQPPIQEMCADLRRLQPTLPRGSSIYFADDPFPASDWGLRFLVRLLYGDMTLEIGRAKPGAVLAAKPVRYLVAFDYRNGHFVPIPPPEPGPHSSQ